MMIAERVTEDRLLQDAVGKEIYADAATPQGSIQLMVQNGIVTLTGMADTLQQRRHAECATLRVPGVHAVVNEVMVVAPAQRVSQDRRIAHDAVEAMQHTLGESAERITISVSRGQIILDGATDTHEQRHAAERAVARLFGVISVVNCIRVRPPAGATHAEARIDEQIDQALRRYARIDPQRIGVEFDGSEVILTGDRCSWVDRLAVERAIRLIPGVTSVQNNIRVSL